MEKDFLNVAYRTTIRKHCLHLNHIFDMKADNIISKKPSIVDRNFLKPK